MGYNLIDLNDLSKKEWDIIIEQAIRISKSPEKFADACKGKIMATLFYEPSTRTQLSFQTAMIKLGGSIIGFDNPQNSSVAKGETIADTIRIISSYADIIAMRHNMAGAAFAGAQFSQCPLINAGDGGHLHPTQTLTDLVTLTDEIGDINGITIGMCGDLINGRTVHSLIKALCRYENIHFVLISTDLLRLPQQFKDIIINSSNTYEEKYSLKDAIPNLDVLYMTRIQQERFKNKKTYEEQKNIYVLTLQKLECAKPDLKILHPLPRVDEIEYEVDKDPRARYFKQAQNGVYARMSLILFLLASRDEKAATTSFDFSEASLRCHNEYCITNTETYLTPYVFTYEGKQYCKYCGEPQK